MKNEEWKDIPGFVGIYQVSNLGRIKRLRHKTKNRFGYKTHKERLKELSPANDGYVRVNLSIGGRKYVTKLVHRLVAQAFIPGSGEQVNHKDFVRSNNSAYNLEWCSRLENARHSANAGRMKSISGPGMKSPAAKLTDNDVRNIKKRLSQGEKQKDIANDYPVCKSAISEIKAGRSWSHI